MSGLSRENKIKICEEFKHLTCLASDEKLKEWVLYRNKKRKLKRLPFFVMLQPHWRPFFIVLKTNWSFLIFISTSEPLAMLLARSSFDNTLRSSS